MGHKVPLISFDPEFVPSIPRSITWCYVSGTSNLSCLGIVTLYLISHICQANEKTTYPLKELKGELLDQGRH